MTVDKWMDENGVVQGLRGKFRECWYAALEAKSQEPTTDSAMDQSVVVNRMIELCGLVADLMGMVAENQERMNLGQALAWSDFSGIAEDIRALKIEEPESNTNTDTEEAS